MLPVDRAPFEVLAKRSPNEQEYCLVTHSCKLRKASNLSVTSFTADHLSNFAEMAGHIPKHAGMVRRARRGDGDI
jgi:hypothetical protein